jgi:hypothetical protein
MHKIYSTRENGSTRVQYDLPTESNVEQCHEAECNINSIIAKARKGGDFPIGSPGNYGDFSSEEDYHSAHNKLIAAKEMFMTWPAATRSRFENDPGKMLGFMNDPDNLGEARELGLVAPEEVIPIEDGPAAKVTETPNT